MFNNTSIFTLYDTFLFGRIKKSINSEMKVQRSHLLDLLGMGKNWNKNFEISEKFKSLLLKGKKKKNFSLTIAFNMVCVFYAI